MAVVRTVHQGGIKKGDNTVEVFSAPTRQQLIKKINTWFFDYFYTHKEEIFELPPLDDWTHSHEDDTCYSVTFRKIWTIWIRHEPLEFR